VYSGLTDPWVVFTANASTHLGLAHSEQSLHDDVTFLALPDNQPASGWRQLELSGFRVNVRR